MPRLLHVLDIIFSMGDKERIRKIDIESPSPEFIRFICQAEIPSVCIHIWCVCDIFFHSEKFALFFRMLPHFHVNILNSEKYEKYTQRSPFYHAYPRVLCTDFWLSFTLPLSDHCIWYTEIFSNLWFVHCISLDLWMHTALASNDKTPRSQSCACVCAYVRIALLIVVAVVGVLCIS